MSHTKGKVKVGLFGLETPDWDRRTIFDEQDNFFADTETSTKTYEEECANARRLVACWNACDGLPQDALDGGWTAAGISQYATRLEGERDALKAENERLRKAAEEVLKIWEGKGRTDMYGRVMENLRAALEGK